MATQLGDRPITKVDRHFGYRIGCDGWVKRTEAAEILGYHVDTIDRLLRRGELRATGYASSKRPVIKICLRSLTEFLSRIETTNVQV